jgi:hypothetical protein
MCLSSRGLEVGIMCLSVRGLVVGSNMPFW